MFAKLKSINPEAITATRRGTKVEQYYADTIGTIAAKYAKNTGAKGLISSAIEATQTPGPGGTKRDPKHGTVKSHLVAILRKLESTPAADFPSRDVKRTHHERDKLAQEAAEIFVREFFELIKAAAAKP